MKLSVPDNGERTQINQGYRARYGSVRLFTELGDHGWTAMVYDGPRHTRHESDTTYQTAEQAKQEAIKKASELLGLNISSVEWESA